MNTITALNRADSCTPMIRMVEMAATITTATRLTVPGVLSKGEASSACGIRMLKSARIDAMVADQLTATVAAPTAYSRTSAQPMIQASNSPMVA